MSEAKEENIPMVSDKQYKSWTLFLDISSDDRIISKLEYQKQRIEELEKCCKEMVDFLLDIDKGPPDNSNELQEYSWDIDMQVRMEKILKKHEKVN